MDIRLLDEYLRLKGYSSLTRASTEIGISQPLLSRHLQSIEKELGVELIDRSGQTIAFTPSGELLIERLQELLSYWEETKTLVRRVEKTHNTLTIGGSFGNSCIVGIVKAAEELSRNDNNPLKINIDKTANLKAFLDDEVDLIICYPLPQDIIDENNLTSEFIVKDKVAAVMLKTNQLASKTSINLEDLKSQHLVKLAGDFFNYGLWWNIIAEASATRGFTPKRHRVFTNNPYTVNWYDIGNDVIVCSLNGAQTGFWHSNPLYKVTPVEDFMADIHAYYKANRRSPKVDQFFQILEDNRNLIIQ